MGRKPAESEKTTESCSLTQLGSTKCDRSPVLLASSKIGFPQLVVVDYDEPSICSAVLANSLEGLENIHGVEDVIEQDVSRMFHRG